MQEYRNDQSWAEQRKLRDEVRRLMDSTKKDYLNEKIVEHRNDSGKQRKSLKQLGYSKKG